MLFLSKCDMFKHYNRGKMMCSNSSDVANCLSRIILESMTDGVKTNSVRIS